MLLTSSLMRYAVIAGAVIGTILGVLNAIIMVTAVALGVVMVRESLKHKETLARSMWSDYY